MRQLIIVFLLLPWGITTAQKLHIDAPVKLLALGDSYTYGQSVASTERWPIQLIMALRSKGLECKEASLVAISGWRTDNLQEGIVQAHLKNEYNLVALLIGVNNYYQGGDERTYRSEFEDLLKTSILLAQGQRSHVVVLSIPDYGYTPFGESRQAEITEGINSFNAINQVVSADYGVPYISITDISRRGLQEPELVAGDRLHPSGKQYALWVQRILDKAVIGEGIFLPDDPIVTSTDHEVPTAQVYPNPFRNSIRLRLAAATGQSVVFRMTDLLGKVVVEKIISGNDEIPTTDLAGGMYTYQIIEPARKPLTGKLIKE